MALIRGKFIDPTQVIKQSQDPSSGDDVSRKSYVDSTAASEAASAAAAAQGAAESYADGAAAAAQSAAQSYADGKVEDALVDGVTNKAPSQNVVVDALALKQNSLGTGTTSQYLRGDLTWQTVVVPTLYQSSQEVFVDPLLGTDAVGRGGRNNPYATINYAYSQVSLETGDLTKWANEKIVLKLAPGVYNEDVSVGFKRRSVMITGTGVKIMGKITVTANRSDYPTAMTPLPYPWSAGFSSPTFEICGQGGGMEDGFTSNNIIVQGQVRFQFAGLINWSTQVGPHYACITNCQLQGGLVGTYENVSGSPGFTVEIDSSSVDGGNIGVMPYVDGGTTTGVLTMSLKAHNSQLKSTLGPKLNIVEIDGCRILNIDRTYGGITNGLISATNTTSYSGIVSSTFAGTIYKLGKASGTGTDTYKMDAMSYGSLKEKTIDNGTGTIAYNLVDKAAGVSVAAAAVNYTRASADVEAALSGIDTALGTKLNLSGGTLSGALALGSNKITGLAAGTVSTDAVNKGQLDTQIAATLKVPHKESTVLTSTDISNGYVNLTRLAVAESTSVHFGGAELMESDDYTVSTVGGVTRITFSLAILALMSAGDKVYNKYWSLT